MIERQRPPSKVSLEDLLRLKRAERPAPEFWAEFEDQLRRKQLAAIVDKRPWWRRLSTASLAKMSVPVGATAVVAFTLATLHERTQTAPDATPVAAASIGSSSIVSTPTAPEVSSAGDTTRSEVAALDESDVPVATTVSDAPGSMHASSSTRSSSESLGSLVATQDASSETSLAQVILGLEGTAESDARPQYQSDATPLMASLDVSDSARSPTIAALDPSPLTQVSAPRDDRRARLLASVDSPDRGELVSGNSRVVRSRERIANRLAEQSLYDSISRLGLNGDSVSIKF